MVNHDRLNYFFSLWHQRDFLRKWVHPRRHRHFFSSLYREKKKKKRTKLWPQCRGMYWTVTFVKRSTPNTVSAIRNKRKKKWITEGLFFSGRSKFCQYIHKSQHMHTDEVKLFIFLWILVYIKLQTIPPKMTWMNGSYTVNLFVAFGTKWVKY